MTAEPAPAAKAPPDAAYGLRWIGVSGDGRLRAQADWTPVAVTRGTQAPGRASVGPDTAVLSAPDGGVLRLSRVPLGLAAAPSAVLSDADLVDPHLARAAAIVNAWLGRETLQAGVVLDARGGAWALLGGRGAGKSTLLAALALEGHVVAADEIAVVADGLVLAGTTAVVVRRDALAMLPSAPAGLAPAWAGTAVRLPVASGPAAAPLAGVIGLAWDDDARPALTPLAAGPRLALLGGARLHGDLRPSPAALLALAADVPALRLARPRTPEGHAAAVALVRGRLA